MPRKLVELSDYYPYHIVARCNNKDWYCLPLETVFAIYIDVLKRTIKNYEIQLHAFVLMSNHFHMINSTPKANLSSAMRYFMTESSRSIARQANRINRIYGKRYHWTIIKSPEHYAHTFKYIYQNPIRAQICQKVEQYKWSALNTQNQIMNTLITDVNNEFSAFIPISINQKIQWLNECEGAFYIESVRKALRHHEFKFSCDKSNGKRLRFDDALHTKNTPGT